MQGVGMIHEHAHHGATGVCHRTVTQLLAQGCHFCALLRSSRSYSFKDNVKVEKSILYGTWLLHARQRGKVFNWRKRGLCGTHAGCISVIEASL